MLNNEDNDQLKSVVDLIQNPVKFSGKYKEPRTSGFLHLGIDLKADGISTTTPVLSICSGVVIHTGYSIKGNIGYGNFIVIDAQNGFGYLYAHTQSIHVKKGQHISAQDPIGIMGQTGTNNIHLHIEKLNKLGIDAIRTQGTPTTVGITGKNTDGWKYREDISRDLLIGFVNFAKDFASERNIIFDLIINFDAEGTSQLNNELDKIKTFLANHSKHQLTGAKRNKKVVVQYQIDHSEWLPKKTAIQLAMDGKLNAVIVTNQRGTVFLRTMPDRTAANNLVNNATQV